MHNHSVKGGSARREPANANEAVEAPMRHVFIEGGPIRKVWPVEATAYRDHLLRLDAESRRNRFCGAIADDIIRSYAVRFH